MKEILESDKAREDIVKLVLFALEVFLDLEGRWKQLRGVEAAHGRHALRRKDVKGAVNQRKRHGRHYCLVEGRRRINMRVEEMSENRRYAQLL